MSEKAKRPTISVPRRFRGGLAEEAYRAGWTCGYEDKALQMIGVGLVVESVFDMAQHGLEGPDPTRVAQRVVEKVNRIGRTTDLGERLRRMEKEAGWHDGEGEDPG